MTQPNAVEVADDDAGILQGFNIIEQYVSQHMRKRADRDAFADFLRRKVTLVRVILPPTTDLNRYFEVMNTRGQQLQQVDIVKARLMSRLDDDSERACFAWIWDACAVMDSYVQMSLTPKNTELRTALFGDDWSWLQARDFAELVRVFRNRCAAGGHDSSAGLAAAAHTLRAHAPTLDEALALYERSGEVEVADDPDNVRFKSTIEFPAFLLHVLKVTSGDRSEAEGQLDDRTLIQRFEDAHEDDSGDEARNFVFQLLRLRNLFDAFVLKRQYTATNGDDGDWSLKRLVKRTTRNRPTPGYVNTFDSSNSDVDDAATDNSTSDVLLLESMLRVTYTSPRTMHWITQLLRRSSEAEPGCVSAAAVIHLLEEYARRKVKEAFFDADEPQGFGIARIVFTYLDYLLLKVERKVPLSQQNNPEFRFAFRNSIEHFYPQYADPQQSGDKCSEECIDLLGNLALVSVGANSKFSNSLPKAKAENFKETINAQSPKLQEMADITRNDAWGDAQVPAHHDTMVALLRNDVSRTGSGDTAPYDPAIWSPHIET